MVSWMRSASLRPRPGAGAGEVEHFVTREIEEAVEGLDGVYRIQSSAGQGCCLHHR
jgi:multidrug efflux pump subunit AcrB